MKTNRCIICGSYESVPLFKLRDFRLDNSTENFPYYKCRVCGLIFQNPQISPETIVDHYNNDEIYCSATSDKGFAKVLNTYGLKKKKGWGCSSLGEKWEIAGCWLWIWLVHSLS
jgi:rubredoxin